MADFTIVSDDVIGRSGASITPGISGVPAPGILAGQACYLDNNDTKWKLMDDKVSTATAGSSGRGIALNAATDGQPVDIITAGDWYAGAAAVEAEDYYGSDAGGLQPRADLFAGDYRTLMCTGLPNGDMRMVGSYTGAIVQ